MSGSATCKYCGRPIVWARTASDANLCVDPNPRADGTHVLEATGVHNGRVQFSVRPVRPEDLPAMRRACHFDTCPRKLR
jgi:hypothetical protein